MTTVRTRIAPSPTGFLHLGTARTALYSWAFARHHGGQFVLRIEDTDVARSTQDSVQQILDSMRWLGLDYDEGPYYQMQRLDRYHEVVEQMIAAGTAYRCWCTPEELDAMREAQRARGQKTRYDGRWRPAPGKVLPPVPGPASGVKPVVRFANPEHGVVTWDDLVKGPISIRNEEIDDLIILRPDGVPTYNFAVVVDDWDMGITHVFRGDEHINNTPWQINIFRALGAPLPLFGHCPIILGEDGLKLSKRRGAVSVTAYEEAGYLPEALLNYLARLGWSHGDDEKFSREQLVEWFDLDHVNRAPAQYNLDKLLWLNGEYIKEAADERLAALVAPRIERLHGTLAGPALPAVCALLKDRARTLNELAEHAMLFYGPHGVDDALIAQHLTGPSLAAVRAFVDRAAATAWEAPALNALIKSLVAEFKLKMPQVAVPLRVALTGRTQTPSIDAVLALFGRERALARIGATLERCT